MDQYLEATQFIDYKANNIQKVLHELELEGLSNIEKAIKIFYYVRDATKYSVHIKSFAPDVFKASNTIEQSYSFCIPKAILLCALSRAAGIPSRIHLVDFINHRLSDKLSSLWGTNTMAGHCYAELYLNEKWVKATPALDKNTCEKNAFISVEFDGFQDGLLHSIDKNGKPHAEYINDHGTFADLPYDLVMNIFEKMYGNLDQERMKQLFDFKAATFDAD
ncbi:MAG: transglutaminase-like domain-containing protein [Candidatus Kariarchaeaceae archaeon]|jgi:transglutaminase-like putative cysteine protease